MTRIFSADGAKRIAIVAKRDIATGEELFYDYKFEFEADDAAVACHCGAKNCRGRMN